MKQCTSCKEIKSQRDFYRNKKHKDGLTYQCKNCQISKALKWARENRTQLLITKKQYTEKNKERMKERMKKYREVNKERAKETNIKWRTENRDKVKGYKQTDKYKERQKQYMRGYVKRRKKIDPHFQLSITLRTRIGRILRKNQKTGSAVRDLGCTIPELKLHLESQFQEGMTWDNHGQYGWHIDHIVPLLKFDLTDRKQFLKACHYTNLQPLWAIDNYKKHTKIIKYEITNI